MKQRRTTMISKNRSSFTHFEDLASEIIYEIFEYFDPYHVYKSFFNLNTRFQNLLINFTVPIQISISSLSKLPLQTYYSYYSDFIHPNKHRIQALHLSDPFIIDFFSSSTSDISKCSQLQTLTLDKIESQSMETLLIDLASLPKLSSLSIFIRHQSNSITLYNLIFQLPVLKYCQITFEKLETYPISNNQSNSIEHFVLNGKCNLNAISSMLSHVPQLRRLSINYLCGSYKKEETEISSMLLSNLKYINLTLDDLKFDQFEQFIKKHFRQVEIFHISTKNYGSEYLNANKWKQLITCYMPHLYIFDIRHTFTLAHFDNHKNTYETLVNQFNSPFWFGRQCSFAYQCCETDQIFFSSQPYRKKYFILNNGLDLTKDPCHNENIFHSVHHLFINGENISNNCLYRFPNATKLTIDGEQWNWFSPSVWRIISLTQLTHLIITSRYYIVDGLIDMLQFTCNLHTLIIESQQHNVEHVRFSRDETVELISSQNKIKYLSIKYGCTLETIRLFTNLCPQLQHLTIGTSIKSPQPIIRYLVSRNNNVTCQLFSLCILELNFISIDKLKNIIQSIINVYSIKVCNRDVYIWW